SIGPDQYRLLLNASYNAIKGVNPGMLVVTGGTSPYGDPPGGPYPPGGARGRPGEGGGDVLLVPRGLVKKKGKGKKRKKGKRKRRTREILVRTKGCPGPAQFDVLAHQAIDNTGGGP